LNQTIVLIFWPEERQEFADDKQEPDDERSDAQTVLDVEACYGRVR